MIPARFLEAAGDRGFTFYTGVPCSYLAPLIDHAIASEDVRYVAAANEGDAVAIAAGSELGGTRSICMFQNSGLGNAVNPLSSLTETFHIPILLVVTHRGEPTGRPDEPQHELMGQITPRMLELLGIPSEPFPRDVADLPGVLDRVDRWMTERSRPFALIMERGTLDGSSSPLPEPSPRPSRPETPPRLEPAITRTDVLRVIRAATEPSDILIATTGYTGRELYALGDTSNQFYMVGSMGCASSLGLGLAIASPRHRIVVLDGDGSALMRLGALATIGAEHPPNLVHLLLDNGRHESTGGQRTVAETTDFADVAAACGYPSVERAATTDQLTATLRSGPDGPLFVHVPIHPGTPDQLPRPSIAPFEVAGRLRAHISESRARPSEEVATP